MKHEAKDMFLILLAVLAISVIAVYCGAWSLGHFLGRLVTK